MKSYTSLIQSNLDTLEDGLELLQELNSSQYVLSQAPMFVSTIGAHYRHLLEHYRCFIDQFDQKSISFDLREREFKLETDHAYAVTVMGQIVEALSNIDPEVLDSDLLIRDQQTSDSVRTSVARELLFLQAHTVHHYAIIAAMARNLGLSTKPDFGLAIATKAFNQSATAASS